MSEHVLKTIEMVRGQVAELESQLAEKKRMVNSLCGLIGNPLMYADVEVPTAAACGAARRDEFYRQPLATAVRTILERRRAANLGAVSVDLLFAAMIDGGFKFTGTNDANNKRALAIALSKNTNTFHRLPNGDYGLSEWYGAAPRSRSAGATRAANGGAQGDDKPDDFGEPAVENAQASDADVSQEEAALPAKPR